MINPATNTEAQPRGAGIVGNLGALQVASVLQGAYIDETGLLYKISKPMFLNANDSTDTDLNLIRLTIAPPANQDALGLYRQANAGAGIYTHIGDGHGNGIKPYRVAVVHGTYGAPTKWGYALQTANGAATLGLSGSNYDTEAQARNIQPNQQSYYAQNGAAIGFTQSNGDPRNRLFIAHFDAPGFLFSLIGNGHFTDGDGIGYSWLEDELGTRLTPQSLDHSSVTFPDGEWHPIELQTNSGLPYFYYPFAGTLYLGSSVQPRNFEAMGIIATQ